MKTPVITKSVHLSSVIGKAAAHLAATAAREKTLAVSCCYCGNQFQVADPTDDNMMVRCLKCTKEFRLANGLGWLNWLELKLPLIIFGFFVFVFQRIPAWTISHVLNLLVSIQTFLLWLVPVSWKLVRVAGWALLAVAIPLVPSMVLCVSAVGAHKVTRPPLQYLSLGLGGLAIAWVMLVVGGYCWAFVHYRRKKKQSLAQVPPMALPVGRHAG